MQFETLETLILLLLFSVPGAVFLYAYARDFRSSERANVIHEQFPLELTVLYLIASAIIHSILLLIFLCVLNIFAFLANKPQLLSEIIKPFSNILSINISSLSLSVIVIILYFFASLMLAYSTGKWWSKRDRLAMPVWCKQIVELRALAKKGERLDVEIMLRDGRKLEGEWHSFSLLSRNKISFEVTVWQVGKNQIIWVPSNNILEMNVKSDRGIVKFLFDHRGVNVAGSYGQIK